MTFAVLVDSNTHQRKTNPTVSAWDSLGHMIGEVGFFGYFSLSSQTTEMLHPVTTSYICDKLLYLVFQWLKN